MAIFLGGLTLGALPFIVQLKIPLGGLNLFSFTISPPPLYKELLIFFTGAASTLLITSVFGLKTILVHRKDEHEEFSKFAIISYEAGYLAILIVLPLLIGAFSIYCIFPVLIVEGIWLSVKRVLSRLSMRLKATLVDEH